jgi:hypothetical protein
MQKLALLGFANVRFGSVTDYWKEGRSPAKSGHAHDVPPTARPRVARRKSGSLPHGTDRPAIYRPRKLHASPLWQCVRHRLPQLRASGRGRRAIEENVLERFSRMRRPALRLRAHPLRRVRPRSASRLSLQDALLLPELPPEACPRLWRVGRTLLDDDAYQRDQELIAPPGRVVLLQPAALGRPALERAHRAAAAALGERELVELLVVDYFGRVLIARTWLK